MLLNRASSQATTLQLIDYTAAGTYPDGGMSAAAFQAIGAVAAASMTWADATATTTNTAQTSGTAAGATWASSGGAISLFGTNFVRFGSQQDAFRRGKYLEGSSKNWDPDCRAVAFEGVGDGNVFNVTATSGNGVSPIVVTHDSGDLAQTNDFVTITGVVGNTAANVTFAQITRISATQFSINGTTGNGNYVSGGSGTVKSSFTAGQADPVGGNTAVRYQIGTGGRSGYDLMTMGGGGQVCEWEVIKTGSGGASFQMFAGSNQPNATVAIGGSAPTNYTVESTIAGATTTGGNAFHIPVDGSDRSVFGGIAGGPRDVILWAFQSELRPGPTSLMWSTGATASRSFGNSTVTNWNSWLHSTGRIDWEYSWTPFWDFTRYTQLGVDIILRWKDSSNNIVINMPSGALAITIQGVTEVLGTLTWSAHDRIDLSVRAGGGVQLTFASYRLAPSGSDVYGTVYSLGTSVTAQPSWPNGTYYEGGDGTETYLYAVVNMEAAYADAA